MDRSFRNSYGHLLLVACGLVALVMLTALSVSGCGSSTSSSSTTTTAASSTGTTGAASSSSTLSTETTIPAESTIVTQASGANAQGPGATVTIHNGTVDPAELQVPVGSAVTFQDTDDDTTRTYQLVSADGSFDTGVLGEGGSYVITFQKPVTIEYHDKNDPSIKGTIVVR